MAMLSPTYLASLFPNGLPQVSPAGIQTSPYSSGALASQVLENYNPLLRSASSQLATTNPNALPQVTPQQVDPSQFGAQPLVNQVLAADQPLFGQQQRALTESLANAGIVGGSTTGAIGDLANQQITQLLGQLAPIESNAQTQTLSAEQGNQQATLGAGEFNTGNALTATLGNQGAQNSLLAQILGLSVPAVTQANNQGLNANEFNASSLNAGNEFNTTNDLSAGQYDTGTANSLLSQILGYQNQDYLQNQQNQLALQEGAAGGQTGAFQPVFSQPAPVNFSNLASAFAQPSHQPQPTPVPNANSQNSNTQWA